MLGELVFVHDAFYEEAQGKLDFLEDYKPGREKNLYERVVRRVTVLPGAAAGKAAGGAIAEAGTGAGADAGAGAEVGVGASAGAGAGVDAGASADDAEAEVEAYVYLCMMDPEMESAVPVPDEGWRAFVERTNERDAADDWASTTSHASGSASP